MVLTAMGSSTKLEDACSALVKMHSKIRALEEKHGGSYHSGSGKGKGYSGGKHAYSSWNEGKGKGKGKRKSKTPHGSRTRPQWKRSLMITMILPSHPPSIRTCTKSTMEMTKATSILRTLRNGTMT